ncbi:MAG: FecR domain-containing protein [Deltaproteobacteria bacterium]|nr:FecR domain-containing protein [Deltaproteobacteria bacterium]
MIDSNSIKQALSGPLPEARKNKLWQEIEVRRDPVVIYAGKIRNMRILMASVLILLFVGISSVIMWNKKAGPLLISDGESLPAKYAASSDVNVDFSDDSNLKIKKGALLEVLDNSATSMRFSLRTGRVDFNITPGGPRKWIIDCGELQVEVVGTKFSIFRRKNSIDVQVLRGAVLVKSQLVTDGVQRLNAGDVLRVDMQKKSTGTAAKSALAKLVKKPKKASLKKIEMNKKHEKTLWRDYVQSGEYKEAYDQLGEEGLKTLSQNSKVPSELFMLSDIARLGGHPQDAVLPLQTIISDFSDDSKAGLAAYTLARLYFEQFNRPGDAAQMYQKAIMLGIPAGMAESAMAKKAIAYAKHDRQKSLIAAQEYLIKYPEGRYRQRILQIVNNDKKP